MGDQQEPIDFGWNCRLLKRDPHPPADLRCQARIERYSSQRYDSLEKRTSIPLSVAARLYNLPPQEIARMAKAGQLEYEYSDRVAQRVTLPTRQGQRDYTLREAAKRLQLTVEQLKELIAAGKYKAFYPDRFMQIVYPNKWEYEKCPLINTGGVCRSFIPHDGPKIRYAAQAGLMLRDSDGLHGD